MKRTIVLILAALLIAGCGADEGAGGPSDSNGANRSAEGQGEAPGDSSLAAGTVRIGASGGESVEVEVEIADDTPEQTRGLMERTALGEDRGMLFVYPDEEVRSFWMKNTLIPLSIAFIASDGSIVDLQDMKPLDDDPPHYVSAEPARYALEVNKGYFEEHGIKVGDRADLPV